MTYPARQAASHGRHARASRSAGQKRSVATFVLLGIAVVAAVAGFGGSASAQANGAARAQSSAERHRSITSGLDCSACHTPSGWQSVGAASGSSGFDHSRTGFPLTQRHRLVACTGCHQSERQVTRECAGCHADPHGARLGTDCDSCHSAASWQQTQAIAQHRFTRLPLTGVHAITECRDCHRRTVDRAFSATPAECFACHADDYRRPDLHPSHVGVVGDPQSPPFPRNCAICHRTTGWLPAFVPADLVARGFAALDNDVPRFDEKAAREHDRVFPISTGSHRGAECQSCHLSKSNPTLTRCNGCHAHSPTQLQAQHVNVLGFGSRCVSCHRGGARR